MATSYDPATGTIRGTEKDIVALRARLKRLPDPNAANEALREVGVNSQISPGDELLTSLQIALASPMLTVHLTNAGPGGTHRHVIDAGVNAVAVRWSTARSDLSELSPSPFGLLPGLMTRLVNFKPGRQPVDGAEPLVVTTELMGDLVADITATRGAAWEQVRDELGNRIDQEAADASWQVVEARCSWISAADGEPVDDLAVYLRAGDAYFVLLENDGSFELVPVPSITAWEVMVHVLPGADEVKDPRKA